MYKCIVFCNIYTDKICITPTKCLSLLPKNNSENGLRLSNSNHFDCVRLAPSLQANYAKERKHPQDPRRNLRREGRQLLCLPQ